jgi:hypothetical protein
MKIFFMAFLFLLSLNQTYSEEGQESIAAQEEENERDTLKKAMDILLDQPFAQTAKQSCEAQGDTAGSLGACVFEELKKSPDDLNKAYDLIDEVKAEAAKENAKPILYESKSMGKVEFYKDPTLNEISKKLSDQFREAIYGELTDAQKKQKIRVVDPQVFHKIYKAQISKNLILNLTEFCIDTQHEDKGGKRIFSYAKDNRNNKLPTIKTNPKALSKDFGACIQLIGDTCTFKAENSACPAEANACSKDDETQQMACTVQEVMYATKQNLLNTDKVLKGWDEFEKGKKAVSLAGALNGQAVEEYNGTVDSSDDRKSIDELTTISSGQFEEMVKSGEDSDLFADNAKKLAEKCKEDMTQADCERFAFKKEDFEKKKKEIDEYELRTKLIAHRLKDRDKEKLDPTTDEGKKNLKNLLEQEGVENAEEILKDQKKAGKIAERIKDNYAAKKESVIARMRAKLEEIAPVDQGQTPDQRISKVTDELSKKREEFSQLIHFSNIMSSFFEVNKQGVDIAGDDNDKDDSPTNSAVAQRELENLGKDFKDSKDQLQKAVGVGDSGATSGAGSDSSGEVTIGIATINNILLPDAKIDQDPAKSD